ncbi:DNA-binding transcriptional regulator YhcF (GntR family) [Bradyrhizobium sp. GM24.11]
MDSEAHSKGRGGTRTIDVMSAVRAKIAGRALSAGDRLPSIRSLAATMSVSPSTVVEAYDRLAAEGLIRARRGSGFYVSPTVTPAVRLDRGRAASRPGGRSVLGLQAIA